MNNYQFELDQTDRLNAVQALSGHFGEDWSSLIDKLLIATPNAAGRITFTCAGNVSVIYVRQHFDDFGIKHQISPLGTSEPILPRAACPVVYTNNPGPKFISTTAPGGFSGLGKSGTKKS